jgi:hypothetical protein
MNEVEATTIDWLWYPYIPFGKITVIQGDPGDGKTTAVLAIAAALTTGALLPESKAAAEPMNVIFQTAEDGLGDTVKPRLIQSGADCTRVIVIDESEKELSLSDLRVEQAIAQTGARLFILDIDFVTLIYRGVYSPQLSFAVGVLDFHPKAPYHHSTIKPFVKMALVHLQQKILYCIG